MSDLTERFKNTVPWASTPAERETAAQQRAKIDDHSNDVENRYQSATKAPPAFENI